MPPRGMRGNTSAAVRVDGLAEFVSRIQELESKELDGGFKDANQRIAQIVVDRARSRASSLGGMEAKAAKTLRAGRSGFRAEVNFGGTGAPFAMGAEFGAHRDKLRIRKSTGGRAYIVRKESERQIAKTIARIEAQTRDGHETVKKSRRSRGATPVAVVGRVRGWNQFPAWTGNGSKAGRFLFPALRAAADDIDREYRDEIDKLMAKAFPEGG